MLCVCKLLIWHLAHASSLSPLKEACTDYLLFHCNLHAHTTLLLTYTDHYTCLWAENGTSADSWGIMQGVGGSAVGGMRARSGELHSIDLSGHQFHKLKCLFTDSDALDHTLYSSGILCGDIMSRCGVILDYPRSRMMFIPQDSAD